jgi:putative transposase
MRKSLRLRDFDYATNGAYFITICTYRRRFILAGVHRDIVEAEFDQLPRRFEGLSVDCRVLQPDHLHAILQLTSSAVTLSRIVQAYKSITTRRMKEIAPVEHVWQRGYYDRIIRNELELSAIREYIVHNAIVHAVREQS